MWAAGAAFLLLVAACAPPAHKVAVIASPASSPSPTPTTPLVAATATFHVGEVGIAYAPVALTATGGVAPYKWTVLSGALPGGLTLGSDGSLSGTPTAGGTFSFTIQVADSGASAAKIDGKIGVAAPLAARLIPACQSYCNVELGCVDVCGSFGTIGGGVGPYAYSLTQGPLPAGTSLNGLALTGTFKGQVGWLQFTVQVSDALGATTTISPKFWMYDHISVAGSATCYGNYVSGCSTKLAISGGIPGSGASVKLVANVSNSQQGCWNPQPLPPPAKSVLAVSGGVVMVSIPPAPEPNAGGYGAIWTVLVVSTDLCGSGQFCTSNQANVTIGVQCG